MKRRYRKHSDTELAEAVKQSRSYAQVVKLLGCKQAGGTQSHIKRRILSAGIDTSHFTGRGWNLGGTDPKRLTTEEVLVYDRCKGRREAICKLVQAAIDGGLVYRCVHCGLESVWHTNKIVLELHHKNGDFKDNRLENLEFVCPNCHQQRDRKLW